MAANEPQPGQGQSPTDDINMIDAQRDQPAVRFIPLISLSQRLSFHYPIAQSSSHSPTPSLSPISKGYLLTTTSQKQQQQQPPQQHLTSHHHITADRPPHPVSPVPIPQIPGRPSPTGAHPTANQGPSAIRSTAATNGSTTTSEDQPMAQQSQQNRAGSSRAASAHPQDSSSGQGQGPGSMATTAGIPTEPTLHGAPVRQYLNSKVTAHLLEGMKMLAKEQYVFLNRVILSRGLYSRFPGNLGMMC